jgi:hypothetical protein
MNASGRAVRASITAAALLFVAACSSDDDTATPGSNTATTIGTTVLATIVTSTSASTGSTAPGSSADVSAATSAAPASTVATETPGNEPTSTSTAGSATTLPGTTVVDTTQPTPPDTAAPTTTDSGTTTTVAPPDDTGTIDVTVPAVEQVTLAPVDVDEPVEFEGGIVAELVSVEQIKVKARLPGEISGPAFVATVRLTNDSRRRLDVDGVTVTLEDRDGIPSSPISGDPADPFSGRVARGDAADAVYVFTFDKDNQSQPVTIGVNYSADEPVAVFVGSV